MFEFLCHFGRRLSNPFSAFVLRIFNLLTSNYNPNNKRNLWETRTATFRLGMLKKTKVFVDNFTDNANAIDHKTDKENGLPWLPKATNQNAVRSEDSKFHTPKGET
jgi:hypothetical protein